MKKGFTLIELLVVVAIMGILTAIGFVAYNGYINIAKRSVTLSQHSKAVELIKGSLILCTAQGGGILKLSNRRSINCDIENNAGNVNSMNNVFINHFLDLGWKNPYGENDPVVYTGRNGSQDRNGRMRFDETECSSGSQKKQIALWVKTHVDSDYSPVLITKSGWGP